MIFVAELKTHCTQCGAEIQLATADRTGGLCMPCKTGSPRLPEAATNKQIKNQNTQKKFGPGSWWWCDTTEQVEVSCSICLQVGPEPVLFTSAQDLLKQLEATRHFGDSTHPNRLELDAQKALLRHAIRHLVNFRLNDDHWARTSFALLDLFEQGKAIMQIETTKFTFSDICKEEWQDVVGPLCGCGGFLYRDPTGKVICKIQTWIS
jgi:hypothetical protein